MSGTWGTDCRPVGVNKFEHYSHEVASVNSQGASAPDRDASQIIVRGGDHSVPASANEDEILRTRLASVAFVRGGAWNRPGIGLTL